MGIVGGEIGYRMLRWFSRVSPGDRMDGSAYRGKSKLRVLLGDAMLAEVRDRDVIDFGCGAGAEAIELAKAGARFVTGVDIQTHQFPAALERARAEGVADRVRFVEHPEQPADVIVSLDSFEHFADPARILRVMAGFLKPGGKVVASFGPTWYHPLGGHLFSVFPWSHLIFSERALIRWRSDFKSDGAQRFSEVAGGLNQMTIARFERIVRDSPFAIQSFEVVPIRRLAALSNRLTREFTTAIVRCTLDLHGSLLSTADRPI